MTYSLTVTEHGAAVLSSSPVLEKCKIAAGDGSEVPVNALGHEVWRGSPDFVNKESGRLFVQTTIPRGVGGFTIREIALMDGENQALAAGQTPSVEKPDIVSGGAFDLILGMEIVFSGAEKVTITIDPSVVYVTETRLQNALQEALDGLDGVSPGNLTLDDIPDGATRSLTAILNRLNGVDEILDEINGEVL